MQPTAYHDYDMHMDEDPETLESRGNVAYMLNIFGEWFDTRSFLEQSILTLRYYEEKSLHLVSRELGIPEGIVRATHAQALANLQETMLQSVQLDEAVQ